VLEGQLYLVDFDRAELDTCLIAKTNMGWLWHRRLAHVGMKNLHKLLKGEHILGLTNVHFEKDRICSTCQAGKQVVVHHPHKNIMTTDRPLELLHMDLFGPIAYISIGGSKYCLVIMDDYSRFTWVFFLQEKSQTQETLKGFLRWTQNEFGLRIKNIRSDNGTEFKNSQIEGFLEEEGIKHEFSSPYMPQQNGVVERKNRTLLDMERTMLDEYKTLDRFWAEAVNTAVGAKAKTPPFARGLRRGRWSNGDKTTGRDTLRPIRHQTKTCDEVIPPCGLVQHGGPRVIRPIVTGPAWPLRVTGLICKGVSVITVCNPALWEYSGDNLGV
jgi:transposase InsO family protein